MAPPAAAPLGREAEAFGDHALFVAAHTLALLQEHYELSHNDLHAGNLLLHPTDDVIFGLAAGEAAGEAAAQALSGPSSLGSQTSMLITCRFSNGKV